MDNSFLEHLQKYCIDDKINPETYDEMDLLYSDEDDEAVLDKRNNDEKFIQEYFPERIIDTGFYLQVSFQLYWECTEKIKSYTLILTDSKNQKIDIPKGRIRKLSLNKSYYSVCGIKKNKQDSYGIIIPFDSYEEVKEIKRVICLWEIGMNEKRKYKILSVINTEFKASERKDKNIYNILVTDTSLQTLATHLEDRSYLHLCRSLKSNYSKVAYVEQANDIYYTFIKGDISEKELSTLLNETHGSLNKMTKSFYDNKVTTTDIYIRDKKVHPTYCLMYLI